MVFKKLLKNSTNAIVSIFRLPNVDFYVKIVVKVQYIELYYGVFMEKRNNLHIKKNIKFIAVTAIVIALMTLCAFAAEYSVDGDTHALIMEDGGNTHTVYGGYVMSFYRDGDIIYLTVFDKYSGISLITYDIPSGIFTPIEIIITDEDGAVTADRYLSSSGITLSKSTAEIVDAAAEIIYRNEGNYGSVNANDNGALSIGKVQWHANRALSLMKTIVNASPSSALSILGQSLYSEIVNAASNTWTSRTVTQSEKEAISTLLQTPQGKAAQDALAITDITTYVEHGISIGIRSAPALVYFADIENQCGAGGSARVASSAALVCGSYADISLSIYHNAALADSVAGRYSARRNKVYSYALSLGWSESADDGLPAFMSAAAVNDFVNYYNGTLKTLYPLKSASSGSDFLNAVMALDLGGYTSFQGATAGYRREYVNTMIKHYLLYEYGYTYQNGSPDTTKKYRSVRNLMNGTAVVLFFEGASNNTENIYSDYNTYHLGAICVVIRLNAQNLPYIAYVNQNSTTIPDRVRHLFSKYSMTTVGTVIDGLYNIITVNHDGYAALNIKSDNTYHVPAIRANKTDTSYLGTSTGINIHSRYTNTIVPESSSWSNTIGCFNVGMLSGGIYKYSEYNSFIKAVCGVTYDAITSNSAGDKTYHSHESGGYALYRDMGIVIVDRYLYTDTLKMLFGNDATYGSAGGSSASDIARTITAFSTAQLDADPSLLEYIKSNSGANDNASYTITLQDTSNGKISANKTTAKKGDAVTITVTPNTGYALKALYVDGIEFFSRTFTVSGNHTVHAVFEKIEVKYSLKASVISYSTSPEINAYLMSGERIAYSFHSKEEGWVGQMPDTVVFDNISEGIYDLVIEKAGHLTYIIKNISVNKDIDLTAKTISLTAGDFNTDGFIDGIDVSMLVKNISASEPETDINGDGFCDAIDISVLAHNLFKSPTSIDFEKF